MTLTDRGVKDERNWKEDRHDGHFILVLSMTLFTALDGYTALAGLESVPRGPGGLFCTLGVPGET
jgi:hypothetical protein